MIQTKKQRDIIINVGFFIEVFLFILSGAFMAYGSLYSILLLAFGLLVAQEVGSKIGKHAVLLEAGK